MANKDIDKIRVNLLKKFGSNAIITGATMKKLNMGEFPQGVLI